MDIKDCPNLQTILNESVSMDTVDWPAIRHELQQLVDKLTQVLTFINIDVGDEIKTVPSFSDSAVPNLKVNWIRKGFVGATDADGGGNVYAWDEIVLVRRGLDHGQALYSKLLAMSEGDAKIYLNNLDRLDKEALAEYVKISMLRK